MQTLPQLLGMLAIYVLGLLYLYHGSRQRPTPTDTLEVETQDRPVSKPESYSGWYTFVYYAGILVYAFLVIVVGVFWLPRGIVALQKDMYGANAVGMLPSPNTMHLLPIAGLFFCIAFGWMLVLYVIRMFPKLARFQVLRDRYNLNGLKELQRLHLTKLSKEQRQQIWEQTVNHVNVDHALKREWPSVFLIGFIMWAWAIPIFMLSLDNYYQVTKQGFVVNTFLSVQERLYTWRQVQSASVYATLEHGSSSYRKPYSYIEPHLDVKTRDGKTRALWDDLRSPPTGTDLYNFVRGLHTGGVTLIAGELDEARQRVLLSYETNEHMSLYTLLEYINYVNEPPPVYDPHAQTGPGFRSRGSR